MKNPLSHGFCRASSPGGRARFSFLHHIRRGGFCQRVVAIRWILDYLKDSVVIVGAKTPKQVLQNAESLSFELTNEQITRLENISKEK